MLCFSVAVRSVLLVAMSPLPPGHQPTTAQHFTSFSPHSASIDLRFGIWHLQFQKTATRRQNRLVPFGPKKTTTAAYRFSYLIFAPLALPYPTSFYLILSPQTISPSAYLFQRQVPDDTLSKRRGRNNVPTVAVLC